MSPQFIVITLKNRWIVLLKQISSGKASGHKLTANYELRLCYRTAFFGL